MFIEHIYPGIYFIESNTDVFVLYAFWIMMSLIQSHPPYWYFFLILVYLQMYLIIYILLFFFFSCCSCFSISSIQEVVDLCLIQGHISFLIEARVSILSGNSAFICLFLSINFFDNSCFSLF